MATPRTSARGKKFPATTIPVCKPSPRFRTSTFEEQESAACSLLEDPWSPCGTARDQEDFRGTTRCRSQTRRSFCPLTTVYRSAVAVRPTTSSQTLLFFPFTRFSPHGIVEVGVPIACVPCAGVGRGRWLVRVRYDLLLLAGAKYYSCVLGNPPRGRSTIWIGNPI